MKHIPGWFRVRTLFVMAFRLPAAVWDKMLDLLSASFYVDSWYFTDPQRKRPDPETGVQLPDVYLVVKTRNGKRWHYNDKTSSFDIPVEDIPKLASSVTPSPFTGPEDANRFADALNRGLSVQRKVVGAIILIVLAALLENCAGLDISILT